MDFLVHECFWRTTCEKRIRQSFFTNFFPGICSLQIVAYVQWTCCKLHLAPHAVPYGSMNSWLQCRLNIPPLCFILEKRPQSHIIQSSFKRSNCEEEHHHNYEVSSSLWHCWRIRKLTKKNTTIKDSGGIMRKKKALRGKFLVRKEKNIHIGLLVYERMMKRDSREVTYWHNIFIFCLSIHFYKSKSNKLFYFEISCLNIS